MNNKIIIVNKKDKVIGYRNSDKITSNNIYRISALWVTNNKGEILLTQRSLDKKIYPGKWQCAVAGTVEEGETYQSNIYKEAYEELGIKNKEFIKGPKLFREGKYTYFCQWYLAVMNWDLSKFKANEKEIINIKWINKNELKKRIKSNKSEFTDAMSMWVRILM